MTTEVQEATITEQILHGEYDDRLDQIKLATHQRTKLLEAKYGPPAIREFVETIRENPGLTAKELSVLTDITPSRIYQLIRMSNRYLKRQNGVNPRRLYVKEK